LNRSSPRVTTRKPDHVARTKRVDRPDDLNEHPRCSPATPPTETGEIDGQPALDVAVRNIDQSQNEEVTGGGDVHVGRQMARLGFPDEDQPPPEAK
jgi:hypothetical protein